MLALRAQSPQFNHQLRRKRLTNRPTPYQQIAQAFHESHIIKPFSRLRPLLFPLAAEQEECQIASDTRLNNN